MSGTAADGIVRIANHGSDHARAGSLVGDSPAYARIGYSTATAPLLDEEGWVAPLEQAVVLLDAAGTPTHRAAMTLLDARVADGVAVSGSRAVAHWVDPALRTSLVTRRTLSTFLRSRSAAVSPAMPDPTTTTSARVVHPGSGAVRRPGSGLVTVAISG